MSTGPKNYEIAYLLLPSIPEGEILTWTGKLTSLIEEAKGVLRRAEEPKKRQLSFPVKKEKNAYFGWTTFSMAPEFLKDLEKKLKAADKLLRHMVIEEEIAEFRPQPLRIIPSRPTPVRPRPVPREAPKVDEKLDLEALDKKLEEILGK